MNMCAGFNRLFAKSLMNIRIMASVHNGLEVMNTRFFYASFGEQAFRQLSFVMREYIHNHALLCLGNSMVR